MSKNIQNIFNRWILWQELSKLWDSTNWSNDVTSWSYLFSFVFSKIQNFMNKINCISRFPDRDLKFPDSGNYPSGPKKLGIGRPELAIPTIIYREGPANHIGLRLCTFWAPTKQDFNRKAISFMKMWKVWTQNAVCFVNGRLFNLGFRWKRFCFFKVGVHHFVCG